MNKQDNLHVSMLVNTDLQTVAFGLYHISSVLKEEGMACFIHKFKDIKNLFSEIREYGVDVIGFSVHWHSQLIVSLKIAEQVISEFPGTKIVLGGITASYFGKDLIQFGHVDFVIVGDGEIPFLHIAQGKEHSVIPNIYWKTEELEVRFNGVSYNTGIERMRDFVYENIDDFRNTRSILKMGKGCFFKCLHCGGRNKALKGHGTDQPVFFKEQDIKHVVERNYDKLKFKHLYLAQDHFRDIKNLTLGIAELPDAITKKVTINLAAWGLPDKEYVEILCGKFAKVCMELTIDLFNESVLKNSRGYCFNGKNIENEIFSYLQGLFTIKNLEIVVFFSYPHIDNNRLIFPDFRTIKAILDLEDLFRKEHLEGRFGICYLLLSTDPGSAYGAKYSFKEYWETMLNMKSGFGSFCFHFKEFMDEDEFNAHHLFIQVLMKLLEVSTNVVQSLYRITFRADIEKFYCSLFSVFEKLYRYEIMHEMNVMQSYANRQAYFGYSATDQEKVGEEQLSNFIYRFLRKCFDEGLIDRDLDLISAQYHCKTRVMEASYISSLDYAEKNAGIEKSKRITFPIKNLFINIFNKVQNINFILPGQLFRANSSFSKRESEALFALFAEFSLKELVAIFDKKNCSSIDEDTIAIIKTNCSGVLTSTNELFKQLYRMTKSYNVNNTDYIKPILKLLIELNDRAELKSLLGKIENAGWDDCEFESRPVNYAITEKTGKLIPLTEEELFILCNCNGMCSLLDLSEKCTGQFPIDIAIFETIIEFFYENRLII